MEPRKYRGLTKDGKWVYGWYAKRHIGDRTFVPVIYDKNNLFPSEIIPGTEGQSTGLKDKKRTKEFPEGQEIYERDIIKDVSVYGGRSNWWDGIVTWHDTGSVGWVAEPLAENKHRGAWGLNYNYEYEVIGNVHQKELLND